MFNAPCDGADLISPPLVMIGLPPVRRHGQVQHVGRGLGIKALRHEAPRRFDPQAKGKNLVGMHAGPLRPSNLRQPAIGSGPVKDAPQLTLRRAVLRTVAFGHPGPGHRLMAW
jgi:hypothetical protein